MSLWRRLLEYLGIRPPPKEDGFELDAVLVKDLHSLAQLVQLRPGELASSLLSSGLALHEQKQRAAAIWDDLSPREQHVAALACLGYSNREISARLVITVETVKTHMSNALHKYGVHNRSELRQVLEGWDFCEWEREDA